MKLSLHRLHLYHHQHLDEQVGVGLWPIFYQQTSVPAEQLLPSLDSGDDEDDQRRLFLRFELRLHDV